MQKIKLLLGKAGDHSHLEIERRPEWTAEPYEEYSYWHDEVRFCHANPNFPPQTAGELQLELVVEVGADGDPPEWRFSLQHQNFSEMPFIVWESEIPDEDLPEVRIDPNYWREIKAEMADGGHDELLASGDDDDDDDEGEEWKNA